MTKEGAIILGTGGDQSNSDRGNFYEGYTSDATDDAVQAWMMSNERQPESISKRIQDGMIFLHQLNDLQPTDASILHLRPLGYEAQMKKIQFCAIASAMGGPIAWDA